MISRFRSCRDDGVVVEEWDVLAGHIEIDVLVAVPFEEIFEMFEGDSEVDSGR